jgi:tetratricopeptide (TPR) repeat protein
MQKSDIERIFRNSTSSNELFDYFRLAIENKVKDEELYKTLLWNRALSPDEVAMFSEKICEVFPVYSYNIFLWVGKIFGATSLLGKYYDRAMTYLLKASDSDPKSSEPLLALAGIYNKELNIPPFDDLIGSIESRLEKIKNKSAVFLVLSDLYKEKGFINEARKYRALAESQKKRRL